MANEFRTHPVHKKETHIALSDIKVASGSWLVANCGDMPSENGCQLVIMGPSNQKDDLVEAAVAHAITHGHTDSAELREGLSGLIRPVEV